MENKVFNYNGTDITFASDENGLMVNATEMAKPFGKRPAKWLELPSTKEFISTLTAIRKSDTALIQSQSGGTTGENNSGGTWSKTITVWTEKGRKFLHELLNVELKDEPAQI